MLRRIAQACLALIVLIVVLSAFMRHHGAGLGCADWPACYGQELPETQAGHADAAGDGVAVARLAHRAAASLALVLILAMLLGSLTARPMLRRETGLAAGLLLLALGLAVLGVLTPGARLPAVTLGNLLGGFLMLALCVRTIAVTGVPGRPRDPTLARLAGLVVILVLAQVVLGALVSATHSGLVCGSLAECRELAGGGGWSLAAFDPWWVPPPGGMGLASPSAGATLQLAHRLGGILVAAAVLVLAMLAWRHGRRRSALALVALLAGVLGLGLVMGGGSLPLPAVLLHNLGAAGLLAVVMRLP